MRTTSTHQFATIAVIAVAGAAAVQKAGPFPPHMLALTVGATGIICCTIAGAARLIMANQNRAIHTAITAAVDERMKRIEHNTGRIVSVEHDVLREIQHLRSN